MQNPFTTPPLSLDPAWIDYNGHLNMAYYNVLFDRALDDALEALGLGSDYRTGGGGTFFTVEVHLRYLAEVAPDALVRIAVRLAGHDRKRIVCFLEMRDAVSGLLHATSEQLLLHVDPVRRKVREFGPEAIALIEGWARRETELPSIEGLGRSVSLMVLKA